MERPESSESSSLSSSLPSNGGPSVKYAAHADEPYRTSASSSSWLRHVWPISPAAMLCLLPFIPSSMYINAGYTKWFHLVSFCYLMTQNKWLSKFLAVMGTTVTLGWWASMCYDYCCHGRYAHILFWNMPDVMTQYMLHQETNQVQYDTNESVAMIALSHVLDTLGHPVLALYFWKQHQYQPSKVLTWSVILCTYALSRVWSFFHNYYNDGVLKPFYVGYDVYRIHDDNEEHLLGMWAPAYIAEGGCYVLFLLYKLYWQDNRKSKAMPAVTTTTTAQPPIPMVLERSSTSISSTSDDSDDGMTEGISSPSSVEECLRGLAFMQN